MDDSDWILNLIQHKHNSCERATIKVIDEIKSLWERYSERELPLIDLRGSGKTVEPYKGCNKTQPKEMLRRVIYEMQQKTSQRNSITLVC